MAKTVESPPHLLADVKDLLSGRERGPNRWLIAAGVFVVLVGIALRFYCPSALWLDETISVNISRLPLNQIPTALSHDGAPPLYYVMLHYWMLLFGQGDVSVRALSGVTSVVTLPAFWYAGRRMGGRRVAWITFFLGVTSPFAIYYATCTRMYSLMILGSVLGFLALARALEQPTPRRLMVLGLITAIVLYTQYWGLFLISVTGVWLLYQLWRHRRDLPTSTTREGARRCFVAMLLGSLLFVPWAPIFVFQTLHTGTPWTSAAGPADVLGIFSDFSGTGPWADLEAFAYFGLIVLGVFGRRIVADVTDAGLRYRPNAGRSDVVPATGEEIDGADQELDVEGMDDPETPHGPRAGMRSAVDRTIGFTAFGPGGAGASARRGEPGRGITLVGQPNRRALPIFGVLAGTLVFAVVAGAAAQAAFVARYTAVVLPLFLLLVALGIGVLARTRLVVGAMCVLCVAGLLTGYGNNGEQRTQAVEVAKVLNAEAKPGDLVLYCPDQLGPAVDRLITVPDLTQLTFPRGIGPERVDWVNYKEVISHTNVEAFAQDMLASVAPGHTVWLVWRNGYPGFSGDCGDLESWLSLLQGQGVTLLHIDASKYYEYENLTRFPTT